MSDSARREAAKAAPAGGKAAAEGGAPAEIFCRRVKRPLPLVDHEQCPYCFGRKADIVTGEHDRFCDYAEGKDPICFGFPETHGHFRTR